MLFLHITAHHGVPYIFMNSATTAEGCKILSHIYSICILSISAHLDFSRRCWITVDGCRLLLPLLHAHLFHPLCSWSAYWIPLHAWHHALALGHLSQAPEHAQRPSCHWSGAGSAHFIAHIRQEGWNTLLLSVITCYCLLLPIADPLWKRSFRYTWCSGFAYILYTGQKYIEIHDNNEKSVITSLLHRYYTLLPS